MLLPHQEQTAQHLEMSLSVDQLKQLGTLLSDGCCFVVIFILGRHHILLEVHLCVLFIQSLHLFLSRLLILCLVDQCLKDRHYFLEVGHAARRIAKLQVQLCNFLVAHDHLLAVAAVELLLDGQVMVPHKEGARLIRLLVHSAQERDCLLKEGVVPVTIGIDDSSLENVSEGLLDLHHGLLGELARIHCQHRVNKYRLVHEEVRADSLAVICHL